MFTNIFILKTKKYCWNNRYFYANNVKTCFYKTPMFSFASHNKTWTKKTALSKTKT